MHQGKTVFVTHCRSFISVSASFFLFLFVWSCCDYDHVSLVKF